MGNKTPWHEGWSREELIERCEQIAKQSNRNNEEANRAWFKVDDLQKRIHKANERCAAHSYVQELEQLCCDLYKALDKGATSLETFVGQPMRVLTDLEELCRDLYAETFDKTYDELSTHDRGELYRRMVALGLIRIDE